MNYHKLPTRAGILAAATCSLVLGLAGQPIPTTTGVTLQAVIQPASTPDILAFEYTASNPPSNSNSVVMIGLDLSQGTGNQAVSTSGLPVGKGFSADFASAIAQSKQSVPIVGASVSAPTGWMVTFTVDGKVLWGPIDNVIDPGQTVMGFQVYSRGLPGLRQFTARPYIDISTLNLIPPSGDPADLQRYIADLNAAEANSITTGITVGPVAPPAVFSSINFLATIQGFETQVRQQGWVKNQGILNSLDQKLNAAKAAMQAGDSPTAKNVLGALLNEVDAQAGKGLSSEAVSLFKFNTQYLISQLP